MPRTLGTVSQSRAPATLTSHRRVVPSTPVVSNRSPSGVNARFPITPLWPARRTSSRPVSTSHTRATASLPAVARRLPSGLKTTARKGAGPAVRAERRLRDEPLVAPQDVEHVAGGRVPEPYRSVAVGNGDEAVVGAQGEGPRLSLEHHQLLAGVRVPHGGGGVGVQAAGDEPGPVGREGQTEAAL